MSSVIEPAAEVYWDAVGTVIDKNGTVEIEPKTDEEWTAVRNSAYVVAEAGNLLMMNGRAKDEGDWMRLSQALMDVGQRAIKAAESKNKAAVFDAGAEVYDACVACHAKYRLAGDETERRRQAGVVVEDPAWQSDNFVAPEFRRVAGEHALEHCAP